MTTKSHNAKKPRLADHHADRSDSAPAGSEAPLGPGGEGSAPVKHKMSFAQHQHELQAEHPAAPLQEAPAQHLKSDAQQHQQKSGSHR